MRCRNRPKAAADRAKIVAAKPTLTRIANGLGRRKGAAQNDENLETGIGHAIRLGFPSNSWCALPLTSARMGGDLCVSAGAVSPCSAGRYPRALGQRSLRHFGHRAVE